MDYSVTDDEADVIVASSGALDAQNHIHQRILDVTIRAGTPQFDNYRRIGNDRPRFTTGTSIALDDSSPLAIKQLLWLTTDRVYRAISTRLIRLKTDEKLRAQASDTSDDFSKEEPQVSFSVAPRYKFDGVEWGKRLRKLSAEFGKYPGALNSSVSVEAQRVANTLVNTEGTQAGAWASVCAHVDYRARQSLRRHGSVRPLKVSRPTIRRSSPRTRRSWQRWRRSGANLSALLRRSRPIRLSDPRFFQAARRAFSSTRFSATASKGIARRTNRKARHSPRASASRCCRNFFPWCSIPLAPISRASP